MGEDVVNLCLQIIYIYDLQNILKDSVCAVPGGCSCVNLLPRFQSWREKMGFPVITVFEKPAV